MSQEPKLTNYYVGPFIRIILLSPVVYKYTYIVGVISEGITEAINYAVVEAAKSVKSLRWTEVGSVTLKIEVQETQDK